MLLVFELLGFIGGLFYIINNKDVKKPIDIQSKIDIK